MKMFDHVMNRARRLLTKAHDLRLHWTALLLGVFALLVWHRFTVMVGTFRNSDDAANFLAGVDLAEGNLRLSGWIMAAENYYPTDVFITAAFTRLFGWHPVFMLWLEAFFWAAIAMVGIFLACSSASRRHRFGIVALALALLTFNVYEHEFRDVVLTNIGSHGSSILLALLVFALIGRARKVETTKRSARRMALLGCLITAGSMADQIFNVIACLPVLAVSLLGLRARGRRTLCVKQMIVTASAMLLARELLIANAHNGGFRVLPVSVALATYLHLLDHVIFAGESITRLLGADFFARNFGGRPIAGPAIFLLRAPLVAMFAITCCEVGGSVVRAVRRWPSDTEGHMGEDVEHLLWWSIFFSFASTCMTTVLFNADTYRFFLPTAVAGSILVARRWGPIPLAAIYGFVVLPASIVVSLALASSDPPPKMLAIPIVPRLIEALRQHNLHQGYAGFWEAAIVTVLSDREITSLPLYEGGDGKPHALGYFDNTEWFRVAARDWHGRVFFISRQPDQADNFELPQEAVYRRFGRPTERIDLGECVINVYNLPQESFGDLAVFSGGPSPVPTPAP